MGDCYYGNTLSFLNSRSFCEGWWGNYTPELKADFMMGKLLQNAGAGLT